MKTGGVAVTPSENNYEARFTRDREVMDICCGPREDFLRGGTPAYMAE